MDLKNKKILVTGASSGIGEAVAVDLAQQGAFIIINFRHNTEGAKKTLVKVKEVSDGIIFQTDLSENENVEQLFVKLKEVDLENLDGLVNNAGEYKSGNFDDLETWEYEIKNTFMSQVYVANAFIKNSDTSKLRKIVNISSVYGLQGTSSVSGPAYSAAKSASNSFTSTLAKKFAPNILVNAVAPGYTLTPGWGEVSAEDKAEVERLNRIKRFVDPLEIAHAVRFLLENDATTGEIVRVDGGLHLLNEL